MDEMGEKKEHILSRGAKIALIFLAVVLAILIIIFAFVSAVYEPTQQTIEYPAGSLSADLFAAKNTQYVKNDNLPSTYAYNTVPFTVDTPEVGGAPVGNGIVYQLANSCLLYLTEFDKTKTAQDVIATEFPSAVLISYKSEGTRITAMQDNVGYIDGLTAEYIADQISVTDGQETRQAALLAYVFDTNEAYDNRKFVVAVGTTAISQDVVDACAQYLDAVLYTLQFNQSTADSLMADSYKASQSQTADDASNSSSDSTADTVDSTATSEYDVNTTPVNVPQDLSELDVAVAWTNPDDSAAVELWLPDGAQFAVPVDQTETTASFVLRNVVQGTYNLKIKGNVGEVSVDATSPDITN